MFVIDPTKSLAELLKVAADFGQKRIELTDEEKALLVSTLKKRGQEELEFGEERECETVRIVRRVTGAVGVYFNS
jgi:hypothetical protein